MIVALDGSGDFRSIQAAIDAISVDARRTEIILRPGHYQEKLRIEHPGVSLLGEDPATTVITWDDHALKLFPDGSQYGTFESYTLFVGGDDFRGEGFTVANTAGPGDLVGQAVAAYVDADRVVFNNCHFLGCQDTLFTGPLPPKPLKTARFGGPREGVERRQTRQLYRRCLIRGDVDFIFGSATAVFQDCEIVSNERGKPVNGYITAASSPEGAKFGYVFLDCRLTGEASQGSVYLGRPWRDFAKTVFIGCWMDKHIHPEGWHNWDKPQAEIASLYGEWGSSGPGGGLDQRVAWSHRISVDEAAGYGLATVLAGIDGWNPIGQDGQK